jgi:hypothetical protein
MIQEAIRFLLWHRGAAMELAPGYARGICLHFPGLWHHHHQPADQPGSGASRYAGAAR